MKTAGCFQLQAQRKRPRSVTRGLIDEELGKREHEREIKKSTLLLGKGFPSSQGKSVNSSDELEGWDKHSKRWFNF